MESLHVGVEQAHLESLATALQAHYAGAVPVDLPKTEQDRIARRLGFLEAQTDAGDIEYDRATARLDDGPASPATATPCT